MFSILTKCSQIYSALNGIKEHVEGSRGQCVLLANEKVVFVQGGQFDRFVKSQETSENM